MSIEQAREDRKYGFVYSRAELGEVLARLRSYLNGTWESTPEPEGEVLD